MAYIEGIARQQAILFPETVDDYITEDNPVQFIDAFVDNLNLAELVSSPVNSFHELQAESSQKTVFLESSKYFPT